MIDIISATTPGHAQFSPPAGPGESPGKAVPGSVCDQKIAIAHGRAVLRKTMGSAEVRTGAGEAPQALVFAAYLVLGALALSPLLWAAVPPLVDYPAYLARMALLAAPGSSQNYLVHWQLIPNLAMDLVVPPLAALLGVETAGRLFIASILALLVAATALLHRVLHGRVGLWPLASLLFLYNKVLYYGFLNYLFALGVALLCFALWIASRNRPVLARLILFSALASLIFILHLFAFGVYGLLIGSYEAGLLLQPGRPLSRAAVGRFLVSVLQFVPAIGLWLANASAESVHYTAYGDIFDKLLALLAPMNFGGIGSMLAPLAAILAVLAWWSGALKLAPAMRWPILASLAVAASMPNWLYGSWAADLRLPVALPFIVIASTTPQVSRRWVISLAAATGIFLLSLRVFAVTVVWHAMDQRFTEFRNALHDLPLGARLLVAQTPMPEEQRRLDGIPPAVATLDAAAFRHIGELATLDRDAFIPIFGTQLSVVGPAPRNAGRYPKQGVPLRLNQLVAGAAGESLTDPDHPEPPIELPGEMPYWVGWPHKFEYLLMLDFGDRRPILPELLQPMARGSFFTLYKITPPDS